MTSRCRPGTKPYCILWILIKDDDWQRNLSMIDTTGPITRTLGPPNDFTLLNGCTGKCVRLSQLGFWMHFKSLHFHSFIHSFIHAAVFAEVMTAANLHCARNASECGSSLNASCRVVSQEQMNWLTVSGDVTTAVVAGLRHEAMTSLQYAVSAEVMTSSFNQTISSGMSQRNYCAFDINKRQS